MDFKQQLDVKEHDTKNSAIHISYCYFLALSIGPMGEAVSFSGIEGHDNLERVINYQLLFMGFLFKCAGIRDLDVKSSSYLPGSCAALEIHNLEHF